MPIVDACELERPRFTIRPPEDIREELILGHMERVAREEPRREVERREECRIAVKRRAPAFVNTHCKQCNIAFQARIQPTTGWYRKTCSPLCAYRLGSVTLAERQTVEA